MKNMNYSALKSRDAVRASLRAEVEATRASAAQLRAREEREARRAPLTGKQLRELRELRAEAGLPDRDEALLRLTRAKAEDLIVTMKRRRREREEAS